MKFLDLLICCFVAVLSLNAGRYAAALEYANLSMEDTLELINRSRSYNKLLSSLRDNWQSPITYLLERGYIPPEVAKPDESVLKKIKSMFDSYAEGRNCRRILFDNDNEVAEFEDNSEVKADAAARHSKNCRSENESAVAEATKTKSPSSEYNDLLLSCGKMPMGGDQKPTTATKPADDDSLLSNCNNNNTTIKQSNKGGDGAAHEPNSTESCEEPSEKDAASSTAESDETCEEEDEGKVKGVTESSGEQCKEETPTKTTMPEKESGMNSKTNNSVQASTPDLKCLKPLHWLRHPPQNSLAVAHTPYHHHRTSAMSDRNDLKKLYYVQQKTNDGSQRESKEKQGSDDGEATSLDDRLETPIHKWLLEEARRLHYDQDAEDEQVDSNKKANDQTNRESQSTKDKSNALDDKLKNKEMKESQSNGKSKEKSNEDSESLIYQSKTKDQSASQFGDSAGKADSSGFGKETYESPPWTPVSNVRPVIQYEQFHYRKPKLNAMEYNPYDYNSIEYGRNYDKGNSYSLGSDYPMYNLKSHDNFDSYPSRDMNYNYYPQTYRGQQLWPLHHGSYDFNIYNPYSGYELPRTQAHYEREMDRRKELGEMRKAQLKAPVYNPFNDLHPKNSFYNLYDDEKPKEKQKQKQKEKEFNDDMDWNAWSSTYTMSPIVRDFKLNNFSDRKTDDVAPLKVPDYLPPSRYNQMQNLIQLAVNNISMPVTSKSLWDDRYRSGFSNDAATKFFDLNNADGLINSAYENHKNRRRHARWGMA